VNSFLFLKGNLSTLDSNCTTTAKTRTALAAYNKNRSFNCPACSAPAVPSLLTSFAPPRNNHIVRRSSSCVLIRSTARSRGELTALKSVGSSQWA
jgi:hypothetical protein